METENLQDLVKLSFTRNFGRTPLKQRIDDIFGEAIELHRFTDMQNLKEEAGDLLASTMALANECGWSVEDLVTATLDKIERRKNQYLTLGRKVKVAIFGGAFDPITIGHIKAAQFVLNTSTTFDEVWIMPCYTHMYNKEMSSAQHRLNMCEIASKIDGRIKVFDYEIKNELRGETFNFVKRLQDEQFAKDEYDFSLIIGLDNANTFDKWVNHEHLENLIRFVVIPRLGVERISGVDWYLKPPHIYLEGGKDEFNELIECSSTMVRKYLKGDIDSDMYHDITDILDRNVLDYIRKNKLY